MPRFAAAALALLTVVPAALPQSSPQWIWSSDGDPLTEAKGTLQFRKTVPIGRVVDEAFLDVAADDEFTASVNGTEVGTGADTKRVFLFDVTKHLRVGDNVLTVTVRNAAGPAGLLVRFTFAAAGQVRQSVVSDATWQVKGEADWESARALGAYGSVGPWKNLSWDAGGDDRFSVPPGFRVETAVQPPAGNDPFSLINLCFDARGRLLVSQENGPILLCSAPDTHGVLTSVKPFCTQVKNCQGMCAVGEELFLVGDGPQGSGLYRVRDRNGDDLTDEVQLLHRFQGGMGEHGPHAVIPGPDGKLYVVIGNHAWAKPTRLAANSPLRRWPNGQPGPDQGRRGTREDVLLPRLNDARGHAADLLAPGGTIWRCDLDGQNFALVAAGFRNHYDAAFSRDGELITFDSDMEWDEGLPWYRPVRVCHCPPGADFLWRTGAANTPDYYLDSLPPLAETGRGSPVGVECYDHHAFPPRYRGAMLLADWAIGVIYAAVLERQGGSYRAKIERLCSGTPMNVTDLSVGPDGAVYFTMGGRGTRGGVARIVAENPGRPTPGQPVQPLAAWSKATPPSVDAATLARQATDTTLSAEERGRAVVLLGLKPGTAASAALRQALADSDPWVRRRACESLIRAGIEPDAESLAPLLAEDDPFVRTAARLVLERMPVEKGAALLLADANPRVFRAAVVALCKTDQAAPYARAIFGRLGRAKPATKEVWLDYLRTVQLALIHADPRSTDRPELAELCLAAFPHADPRVSRELAIVLTHLKRSGVTTLPVREKLLAELLSGTSDRGQQIHYFYCLRLLTTGWTASEKAALLGWFDGTKDWAGGFSFAPFLEAILRDLNPIFTAADRAAALAEFGKRPWAAAAMLRLAGPGQVPPPMTLLALYESLMKTSASPRAAEMREGVVEALARFTTADARAALRKIGDLDPRQRVAVARALARGAAEVDMPYLARALGEVPPPLYALEMIDALMRSKWKPAADDAAAIRGVLLMSQRLPPPKRWRAIELLRHWSGGRQFGAEDGEWRPELAAWAKWYAQAFPKEPPPPDLATSDRPTPTKYTMAELLAVVGPGSQALKGDPSRGRLAFAKASCIKCHKYGTEGEGIGPDLTTLAKRFKRADVLEAIVEPSKAISDQYRSTLIVTTTGQQVNGLATATPDGVTVLIADGSKVTIRRADIEAQYASLVSVMPEKLLDTLTPQEIADLFAYLECDPTTLPAAASKENGQR